MIGTLKNDATRSKLMVAVHLAAVAVLSGCGVSANPFRIGNLPVTPIVRTHAKPSLRGYYRNFDPKAHTLTVTPKTSVNPVNTQHVIVATVCDDKGNGRRNRRVEWHLDGPGHIVEVDESGFFSGRGYLVDGKYAVSYTNYKKHTLTRGNDDPSDDIQLVPGQSWCVITSAVEGETHVTCYAPGIYDWEKHKVFVTKRWVDAAVQFPPPAVNPAGTPHRLVTRVTRISDGSPAAGYRVRYRILDGPPAVLEPGAAAQVEVVTDVQGNAVAVLQQVQPGEGVNRVQIEVIRPGLTPTAKALAIDSGVMTKTWVMPKLDVRKDAPQTAVVGQQIPYQITVTNNGSIATQGVQIRDTIPPSLRLLSTTPQASQQGNNLIWSLGALQPGQSAAVQFVCEATAPGTVTNCAEAVMAEGMAARSCATTQVLAGALAVTKSGPSTAVVGQPVTFQITVTNRGNGPATNVKLQDTFDPGFAHQTGSAPVELPIGNLDPGQSRTLPIVLTPRTPGRLCNRVSVTADGGLSASAEHCVDVSQPQIAISKRGPKFAMVGAMVRFELDVQNTGSVPATSVIVRDELPPQLRPQQPPQGAVVQGNAITWNVGNLAPGQTMTLQFQAQAVAAGENVCNSATASANGLSGVRSNEVCLNIRGVPGLLTELIDRLDPVAVGGETVYVVKVTNQGTVDATDVRLECTMGDGMQFVDAGSATNHAVDGNKITFEPFTMAPRRELLYEIKVRLTKPGDLRFEARVSSAEQQEPVIDQESTRCYDPNTGKINGSAAAEPLDNELTAPVNSTQNEAESTSDDQNSDKEPGVLPAPAEHSGDEEPAEPTLPKLTEASLLDEVSDIRVLRPVATTD